MNSSHRAQGDVTPVPLQATGGPTDELSADVHADAQGAETISAHERSRVVMGLVLDPVIGEILVTEPRGIDVQVAPFQGASSDLPQRGQGVVSVWDATEQEPDAATPSQGWYS